MPGLSQPPPPTDAPVVDTAEQVYISSLALLKMLKHGRAGVPMEVMGLMLGEFQFCLSFAIAHKRSGNKIFNFIFRGIR